MSIVFQFTGFVFLFKNQLTGIFRIVILIIVIRIIIGGFIVFIVVTPIGASVFEGINIILENLVDTDFYLI